MAAGSAAELELAVGCLFLVRSAVVFLLHQYALFLSNEFGIKHVLVDAVHGMISREFSKFKEMGCGWLVGWW